MTASFVTVCDAVVDLLTAGVTGLGPDVIPQERIHRYGPWNPDELLADGSRHLAVWPMAEAETPDRDIAPTGFQALTQLYTILVWELSSTEASRGEPDEEGTKALLNLWDDVKQVVYANQHIGGSWRSWYSSTTLPESTASVRWFRIGLEVMQVEAFT